MSSARAELADLAGREYASFSTELDTDFAPRGLSGEVIWLISSKKDEPK